MGTGLERDIDEMKPVMVCRALYTSLRVSHANSGICGRLSKIWYVKRKIFYYRTLEKKCFVC